MRRTELISYSAGLTPVSGVFASVKSREKSVADKYKTWTESFLASTADMERETLTIHQRMDLSNPAIMPSIDWDSSVYWHLMRNLHTNKFSPMSLDSLGDYLIPFPAINEKFLPKIDDALTFLNMKIERSVEGIFFNLKGTPGRSPGFVVDMRIVIPEYDRELEREIYHALAEIISKSPELSFDAHVIASKKRKLQDFLPHGYNRYVVWSG